MARSLRRTSHHHSPSSNSIDRFISKIALDKTRERDPDIRKMLLEALTQVLCTFTLKNYFLILFNIKIAINQLCATKYGREYLRSKNTYVILRELHKWEKDENVMAVLEHLVNIIIR